MGSLRRMSKFDRLPESETDDDEEDDIIDPEEEARQRAALKRAQPKATKKVFAGLSSALSAAPASANNTGDMRAPGGVAEPTAQQENEDSDFADFESGSASAI